MSVTVDLTPVLAEFETGLAQTKCQQCGCMQGALAGLTAAMPNIDAPEPLAQRLTAWTALMQPVRYACLGCAHCYPAVGQNAFAELFPTAAAPALSCDFQAAAEKWPPVAGEYVVLDPAAPVAVSTLASLDLVDVLAAARPAGLAIVGKTETENIGLDKLIKNVIANPALRWLIVAGREPAGHQTGQALLALAANGVDPDGRIISARGKRPILRNVIADEIAAFRRQVQVVDLIGCEAVAAIQEKVAELADGYSPAGACGCGGGCAAVPEPEPVVAACGCGDACHDSAGPEANIVAAALAPEAIRLDKAGYFVILPLLEREMLTVEHYAYDNALLRVVEGRDARTIYHTLIAGGWVTELSHAAYLGKELARAELSLQHGFKYVQDGA